MARLYKRKKEAGLKGHDPAKHRSAVAFAAPVHPGGGSREVSNGLRLKRGSIFQSSQEAYKSYAKFLVRELGYTQGPNRQFHKEGEPVLVLTKPSRFGYRMKGGKGKRLMPKRGSGMII